VELIWLLNGKGRFDNDTTTLHNRIQHNVAIHNGFNLKAE